jgi:hypothetical protein
MPTNQIALLSALLSVRRGIRYLLCRVTDPLDANETRCTFVASSSDDGATNWQLKRVGTRPPTGVDIRLGPHLKCTAHVRSAVAGYTTALAWPIAVCTLVRAAESPPALRISVKAWIIASVAWCGSSRVTSSVNTEMFSWST